MRGNYDGRKGISTSLWTYSGMERANIPLLIGIVTFARPNTVIFY